MAGEAGLISGIANIAATALQNKANMDLAKYSYEQQQQMIAQQNEYNSPKAQMARYEEAGLNPHLIYGSGQQSAGNQSQIARYEAPQMSKADLTPAVTQAMNQIMMKKDLDLKEAEMQLRHQQFENLKEEQFRIRAERHSKDIENMWNSYITGFDPGLVSQVGDMDKIAHGMRTRRYSGELMNLSSMYEYRQAQKAYLKVQEEVAGMNLKQKQYYYDNIQPLMKEILDKKSKGLDYSNELLRLETKFYRANQFYKYGVGVAGAVSSFISPIKIGGGVSSPGNSTYGFGSDFSW